MTVDEPVQVVDSVQLGRGGGRDESMKKKGKEGDRWRRQRQRRSKERIRVGYQLSIECL